MVLVLSANADAMDFKKIGTNILGNAKKIVEDTGDIVNDTVGKITKNKQSEDKNSAEEDSELAVDDETVTSSPKKSSAVVSQADEEPVLESDVNYQGESSDGYPNGKGAMTYANGDTYTGEWINGKRQGEGVLTSANGDVYEGGFFDNSIHGKGIKRFASGIRYEGDVLNGNFTGKGKLYFPEGHIYEGDFVSGKFKGKGKLDYANGNKYEGDFVNSLTEGIGTLYYANGAKYEGEFLQNKLNGIGTMHYSNGEVVKANWKNDELVSRIRSTPKPRFKKEITTSSGMSVKVYDHSIQPTGLPVSDAKVSDLAIKKFAINMTESDFTSRVKELGEDDGSCLVNGEMEAGIWMNNKNDNSGSKDAFDKYHMSKCFTRGSLYAAWFFEGRAKKISINTLGKTSDVAAALEERYGKPTKTIDMRGKGKDLVVSDNDSAFVFNSGDLIHREYWLKDGTSIELNMFPPEAELTLTDHQFAKELGKRLKNDKKAKLSTLLD